MRAKILFYLELVWGVLVIIESGSHAQQATPSVGAIPAVADSSAIETALQWSRQTGSPLFVIAGRKTCQPCRVLKLLVNSDKETGRLLQECAKVYLDCDSVEYQQWTAIHPPSSNRLPQWYLIRADGKELINRSGGVSGEELRNILATNLPGAGKVINASGSSQIEQLTTRAKGLLEGQDAIAAAEVIVKTPDVLQIANHNYSESSKELRELLQRLQSELVRQIESARKRLREIEALDEQVRDQQLNELRAFVNRLRSIPSVSVPLTNLESEVAGLERRLEKSIKRLP